MQHYWCVLKLSTNASRFRCLKSVPSPLPLPLPLVTPLPLPIRLAPPGVAAEQAARLAYREERRRAQRRSTVAFAVERERRRALRELRAAGVVT